MIDQGSESCFVSQKVCKILKAPRKLTNVVVHGIGAIEAEHVRTSANLIVRGRRPDSPAIYIEALIMKQLTNFALGVNSDFRSIPHLADLELADDNLTGNQSIELILGAEVLSSILRKGVRIGREDEPVAQETIFGWIVSGRIGISNNEEVTACMHLSHVDNIEKLLRTFWET